MSSKLYDTDLFLTHVWSSVHKQDGRTNLTKNAGKFFFRAFPQASQTHFSGKLSGFCERLQVHR